MWITLREVSFSDRVIVFGLRIHKRSSKQGILFYYPLEVMRGEYCLLGVFLLPHIPLVRIRGNNAL